MSALKLGQLPERTPVKITITMSAELNRELCEYAMAYNEIYGQSEPVTELVPHILAAFLAEDRAFQKGRATRLSAVRT